MSCLIKYIAGQFEIVVQWLLSQLKGIIDWVGIEQDSQPKANNQIAKATTHVPIHPIKQ